MTWCKYLVCFIHKITIYKDIQRLNLVNRSLFYINIIACIVILDEGLTNIVGTTDRLLWLTCNVRWHVYNIAEHILMCGKDIFRYIWDYTQTHTHIYPHVYIHVHMHVMLLDLSFIIYDRYIFTSQWIFRSGTCNSHQWRCLHPCTVITRSNLSRY